MQLNIPQHSLVLLIGASGSGKSTFARRHFLPSEIVSSDYCRYLICDDQNNQDVTEDAFQLLRFIARKRLALGKLTVIDATNVQAFARQPLLELAREFQAIPVAIVLNLPERLCFERNRHRIERSLSLEAIQKQAKELEFSLEELEREGFRYMYILDTPEKIDEVSIERRASE